MTLSPRGPHWLRNRLDIKDVAQCDSLGLQVESSARDTFLAPCYVGCVQSKKTRETKERLEAEGRGRWWLGVTPLTHFVFLLVVCEAIHRLAGTVAEATRRHPTLHGGDQANPFTFTPVD